MKAIFLCQSQDNVKRVYSDATVEQIRKNYTLSDKVFSRDMLNATDFTDVEAIFSTWGMPSLSAEQIKSFFPSLKAVYYAAGSVQTFARPFLDCGVRVFSAWKANAVPVIEYAVAQILLANKGFYATIAKSRSQYFEAKQKFSHYKGNYGARVGILGDGAIGGEVIKRLTAFNLEVYVFSVTMTQAQADRLGVRLATLPEIFSSCDVISNHLADNEETKGIITERLLRSMQDYGTFINTGRGAQVDEQALIDVLTENATITAVLDVTNPEPPEEGSALYSLPNVFLTPHIAGSSGNEVERMALYMAEESNRLIAGQEPLFEVTMKMLESMA